MKKIVRLTEEDLSRLVNKVVNEQNVINIKSSTNLREIPDGAFYRNISMKRAGNTLSFYIKELKTRFEIRIP
jgi:hypothetical protein